MSNCVGRLGRMRFEVLFLRVRREGWGEKVVLHLGVFECLSRVGCQGNSTYISATLL